MEYDNHDWDKDKYSIYHPIVRIIEKVAEDFIILSDDNNTDTCDGRKCDDKQ